jgi:predicted nucleic acid-binding protein
MSSLIVDASVVVKLLLDEPDSPNAALLVQTHDILVPDFARLEVGNTLWSRVHAGELDRSAAQDLLALLDSPDIEFISINPLVARALALAAEIDHPIYDCAYLALAELRRIPLVTADNRFLTAVRKARLAAPRVMALSEMA